MLVPGRKESPASWSQHWPGVLTQATPVSGGREEERIHLCCVLCVSVSCQGPAVKYEPATDLLERDSISFNTL